jgi:hypothetical protein
MWVFTIAINDYKQHEECFLACWDHKPNKEELLLVLTKKEIYYTNMYNDTQLSALIEDEFVNDSNNDTYHLRLTRPDGTIESEFDQSDEQI